MTDRSRTGGWQPVAAAVTAAALLAGGCEAARGANPAREAAPTARPAAATAAVAAVTPAPALAPDAVENEPLVPLQSTEELIRVITENLDDDESDEQLLLVRSAGTATEEPANPALKLVVVDSAGSGPTHRRTWGAETRAVDPRTFNVQLQDLVGDHHLEIVARGINARGERTLDLFRQAPFGAQLAFTSVLSVAAQGTIEIQEQERPESYVQRQTLGAPFPIVVLATDPQGSNVTDLLKTTYRWQQEAARYQALPAERIPGAVVEERQLRELFASSATETFERFLAGPWYRPLEPGAAGPLTRGTEVIHFEPERRRITLFDGDVQEIYTWEVSHRLLSSRLGIWVRNELVPSIQKTINVEVTSLRDLRVVMKGRERGDYADHHYEKLTTGLQTELARATAVDPGLVELHLSGLYRTDHGDTIIFESPRFTWLMGSESESGGYAIYSVGQPVIVFKVMSPGGVTRELRSYTLEYDEHLVGDRLFRSILLRPATLAVDGVSLEARTALRFEQVEIVQETTAEEHAGPGAAAAIVVTPAENDRSEQAEENAD